MTMPLPPKHSLKTTLSGELTINEADFILDSTLKTKHRSDASVIAFINSFIRCKSIKQACGDAGVHYSLGYSIRHRKDVANAITKLIGLSATKYGYDASEIFERAKEIAEFDPIDLMNPDGTYKESLHDIPPEARRCIKKLEVNNLWSKETDINGLDKKIIIGKVVKVEFWDKMKGIELAGKEKEMFKNTTKVEHGLTKDMASLLLASSKRADAAIEDFSDKDVIDITPVENDDE